MPIINYTLSKSRSFKTIAKRNHSLSPSIEANENEEMMEQEESSSSSSSPSSSVTSLSDIDLLEKALSSDECCDNTSDSDEKHLSYAGIEIKKSPQESSFTAESSLSESSYEEDLDNDINNNHVHKHSMRKSILKNTSSSSLSTKRTKKERVQFGNLQMRFYNRVLGDNPACQTGPPLELDWSYNKNNIFDTSVDDYEIHRLPRRTRRQLVMTNITRRNMMIYHFGCTHDDIDKAANGIKKIQRQREVTKSLSPAVERRQEMKENLTKMLFGRRITSINSIGRKSRSSGRNRDDLMTLQQRRSVESYEDNHLNQLLMVR